MKILMMARNPKLYSHQRLLEAARAHGHQLDIIDTLQMYMNIAPHNPQVKYKGQLITGYMAVIPRIGASITMYGLAVLRQLENMGVWSLNDSVAIARSRDKLRCMQILARRGIGLPVTGFSHSALYTDDMIEMVGGAPVVIKLLEGTQGLGVVLGETRNSARSVIEAFRKANVNILLQEYIKEAGASDVRCIVVGGKVVASMMRTGSTGEFRSNLHRGGTATKIKISPEERSIAVRSATLMGLNVCGVDLLRTNHGPVVLEINSSPGLEGVEKATGIDVATKIIEYIETHVGPAACTQKEKR
ncbi:MAG: ribosomal protein S6 modification protein [Alphaproteobacteria bacterium GWC2_42_16]|nr:MAG: ribosomal protein S6 modification protein [Alphaproteobacteria bacterium GWC2_42_16]OFW73611.1 MAG: ribosomal protein S6 modification protein [Alphaproteobacteria bacterium GWA2_41_27]OFW81925.1 MAG: ribosomal protein S6 modification protein [Alphaproteobacteria bacterium RIFCSPHIGHO2_12_FULL_42_100]OFW84943.1 MAG: ribosomal protein S6 modification protein [Alphaproteobacteria bacterium RBG_16_42_14]OFW91056.1 MAG: ribosomal protein S6 modification protein [Alphaproteobacteria bacterium